MKIERGDRQTRLLLIDVQNTFCLPEFELFIGCHSGCGAIDDSNQIYKFIYPDLGKIYQIIATMDTYYL
jgi:nicotinamidase-related amidase